MIVIINIGKDNTNSAQDRGLVFNYISSTGQILNGFMGFNPSDEYFRLLTNVSGFTNNIAYSSTRLGYTLGNLELNKLIVDTITNNIDSNTLNIEAADILNLKSANNMNLTSTTGDINIKCNDNTNSVIIGNGDDSKTVIDSNLEITGSLISETYAFFNSNVSTYAKKNLLLFLDNTVTAVITWCFRPDSACNIFNESASSFGFSKT